MAIYTLLQDVAFGPEEVDIMSAAYEATLKELRLVDRTDPVTQIIAQKIIEIARTNERDPMRISKLAIEKLGIPNGN